MIGFYEAIAYDISSIPSFQLNKNQKSLTVNKKTDLLSWIDFWIVHNKTVPEEIDGECFSTDVGTVCQGPIIHRAPVVVAADSPHEAGILCPRN